MMWGNKIYITMLSLLTYLYLLMLLESFIIYALLNLLAPTVLQKNLAKIKLRSRVHDTHTR